MQHTAPLLLASRGHELTSMKCLQQTWGLPGISDCMGCMQAGIHLSPLWNPASGA